MQLRLGHLKIIAAKCNFTSSRQWTAILPQLKTHTSNKALLARIKLMVKNRIS
ncbi:unnamed protein product, partial [Brassica rapa subsp. narinosa]